MVTCFVLINVVANKEDDVYNALVNVDEIEGIREVFGQYDLIARAEADDLGTVRKLIIDKVRSVDGVVSTATLVTTE